tara:strand:- start:124 stop:855 length:732 start_codon:yes stop_codon:yes gene_type:complete
MPNSDHLNLPYLTAGQTNPDVTINNFLEGLDDASAGSATVDFTSDADLTPTAAENKELQMVITDTSVFLTVPRNVILESYGRFHIVKNDTAQDLTFKNAAGTGVTVSGTVRELIYNDGTNVYSVSGQNTESFLYDLGVFVPGLPAASDDVMRFVFSRSVDFPAGLTASQGYCETQATAQYDFDVQKNGGSVGTVRFAIATSAATFIMASPQSFVAGDRIAIIASATPDATLNDVYITLKGTRV